MHMLRYCIPENTGLCIREMKYEMANEAMRRFGKLRHVAARWEAQAGILRHELEENNNE